MAGGLVGERRTHRVVATSPKAEILTNHNRPNKAIRETLEQALTADPVECGIVLSGGSAVLRNRDRFITGDADVRIAQDPLSCVIHGIAHQLNQLRTSDWYRFGSGCGEAISRVSNLSLTLAADVLANGSFRYRLRPSQLDSPLPPLYAGR